MHRAAKLLAFLSLRPGNWLAFASAMFELVVSDHATIHRYQTPAEPLLQALVEQGSFASFLQMFHQILLTLPLLFFALPLTLLRALIVGCRAHGPKIRCVGTFVTVRGVHCCLSLDMACASAWARGSLGTGQVKRCRMLKLATSA